MTSKQKLIGAIAIVLYGGSILAANWLIRNVGTVTLPDGTHLVPVGFGLLAPSGSYAAGVTFVARDVVQRAIGRRAAIAAVVAGTVLSALVDPRLALASGSAFFFSEMVDLAVYTPLERRNFALAVLLSGVAGIPLAAALPGLLLAKLWIQLLATPVAGWLREQVPARA